MSTAGFDGLVCDLDGVVYRGDQAVPGAPEAITELRRRGVRIVYCTNNSRSTVAQYRAKLARLSMETSDDEILTSATVTAEELVNRGYAGCSALVFGGDGIRQALKEAGIEVIPSDQDADLVVVGLDVDFNYNSMARAALAVAGGARLIATNDDAALPMPEGLLPGAGAILASIETATGVRGEVMGKPHRPMMDAAARRLEGCKRIAVVGDRPETDLAGGVSRGWTTILVTSGVTSADAAGRVNPKPDVIVPDLFSLLDATSR